jgi:hypothetical protein
MIDRPIAVISYNRPDLLERFLASLKAQTVAIDPARVALFQDHGDPAEEACVAVFRAAFPEGQVFQADSNLGVALNIDRAERHVFETLGAEVAYFFEDDLILGPHYLDALGQLADFALTEERVGYVAAYGDHRASAEEQAKRCHEVIPMDHKWGFALTKRQWERQKPIVDGYLNIVRQRPYRSRDHSAITAYFQSLGCDVQATSQDAAKDVALVNLGTIKIMSLACFGKYEGSQGLHFRPDIYEKLGYGSTHVYEGVPVLQMPTSEQIASWVTSIHKIVAKPPKSLAGSKSTIFGRWSVSDIKPVAHMDDEGLAMFEACLSDAKCLLEFGSGGSSMTAARMKVSTIISVESDADFLAATEAAVRATAIQTNFIGHYADIGPTRDWGNPADRSKVHLWPRYCSSVWVRIASESLPPPDLVLIDGRFRVACLLVTLLMARPGTKILFDDYFDRPHYHRVEAWATPVRRAGRMAEFAVPVTPPPLGLLPDLLAASTDFG